MVTAALLLMFFAELAVGWASSRKRRRRRRESCYDNSAAYQSNEQWAQIEAALHRMEAHWREIKKKSA